MAAMPAPDWMTWRREGVVVFCIARSLALVPQRRQVLDQVDELLLRHRLRQVLRHDRDLLFDLPRDVLRRDVVILALSILDRDGVGSFGSLQAADDFAFLRLHNPALVPHQNPGVGFEDRLIKLCLAELLADRRERRAEHAALRTDLVAGDALRAGLA